LVARLATASSWARLRGIIKIDRRLRGGIIIVRRGIIHIRGVSPHRLIGGTAMRSVLMVTVVREIKEIASRIEGIISTGISWLMQPIPAGKRTVVLGQREIVVSVFTNDTHRICLVYWRFRVKARTILWTFWR